VSYSKEYFPSGHLRRDSFRDAETAAGLEFRTIAAPMRDAGCRDAVGSSGTVEAVADLIRANQLSNGPITLDALKKLRKMLVQAGKTENLDLPGMKVDRRPVLAGGLAILIAAFKSLDLESMTLSAGALREGVLYDLIGRIRHQDVRDRTIRNFVDRYRVDVAQAARVEKTALGFLAEVGTPEGLDEESARALLSWAAWLHEIGLVVAYAGYHRHGAYLVANSDLPGFSRDDQLLLASLVRAHRRRLRDEAFADVPAGRLDGARKLIVLLRLAVLFHRSRDTRRLIRPRLEWRDQTIRLVFPAGWTEKHPLTVADLEQEREFLAQAKIGLDVSESKSDSKSDSKAPPKKK
jgi:exopolyphosphatase/guanosine-5'-triphosphate,3'-diphosphate pyrophosphatase